MRHISTIMNHPSLKRAIMRRIYYSFALSIFTHRLCFEGMFLSIAGFLLADWLHVSSIIDNLLSVPVREVPNFFTGSFLGAISHGEVLTAAVFVATCVVTASVGHHLATTFPVRRVIFP